jgi:hypothetical protein
MNPNFFIVGAPKCGTTNMSYYLMQHPQVFMPEELEPYYFARLDIHENYSRYYYKDKEKYLKLFKNSGNKKAIGESSPVYLSCPHSALDIKQHFPDSKIIISIRNPIEITQSMYFSAIFNKRAIESFGEVIDLGKKLIDKKEFRIDNILEPGFYSKHILRFKEIFPEKQIKVIIFEDYIKNTVPTINSILKFLDIEQTIEFTEAKKGAYRVPKNKISEALLNNNTFRKMSRIIIPDVTRQKIGERYFVNESKKPEMLSKDRVCLKEIFESDVKKLSKIIQRELPWSDFN